MQAIPTYLARFDDGRTERFVANSDAVAMEYVREILADDGCDDGEAASVYLVNEGGRGDEEFIGEVVA
jgi:hypothetical protein